MRWISFALASLLAFAACARHGAVDPGGGQATLVVRADLSATTVASVVVEVTAPDFATAMVFNIPIVNRVATGTITLQAGSSRTITMRAFDAGGVQTHRGSVTVNIQPGTNPTISIVLMPLTGDVSINATLGSFTVTVMPNPNSLRIGGTVQLTALVRDWNGNTATETVAWATYDPSIASVDASGLVSATGAGNTTISATFRGATATTTVSVSP